MREIKFRVWDGKKMYNDGFVVVANGFIFWLYYLCGDGCLKNSEDIESQLKERYDIDFPAVVDFAEWNDHIIPMRWTGLKDKNGADIYEGDIITIRPDGDATHEIFWNEELACFMFAQYGLKRMSTLLPESGDCEVIGNIYENPELLHPAKEEK